MSLFPRSLGARARVCKCAGAAFHRVSVTFLGAPPGSTENRVTENGLDRLWADFEEETQGDYQPEFLSGDDGIARPDAGDDGSCTKIRRGGISSSLSSLLPYVSETRSYSVSVHR